MYKYADIKNDRTESPKSRNTQTLHANQTQKNISHIRFYLMNSKFTGITIKATTIFIKNCKSIPLPKHFNTWWSFHHNYHYIISSLSKSLNTYSMLIVLLNTVDIDWKLEIFSYYICKPGTVLSLCIKHVFVEVKKFLLKQP